MAWIYIVGDVLFLDLDPWCETNEFGFGFGLRWFLGKLASLTGICIMMCDLCILSRLCFRVNYLPLPIFLSLAVWLLNVWWICLLHASSAYLFMSLHLNVLGYECLWFVTCSWILARAPKQARISWGRRSKPESDDGAEANPYLARAPKQTRIFEMFVWVVDGMCICGLLFVYLCMFYLCVWFANHLF